MAEAIKMGGGSSKIINGIIEEYYSYYNDISPNTFVEYIGELSYPYSNSQVTELAPQNSDSFLSPVAIQLNDNTVIIVCRDYNSTYTEYLMCVALTFNMNDNTISIGSPISTSLSYSALLSSDYSHLVRINDTTFAVIVSITVQELKEYSQYIYYTTFSVSSNNTITLLQKEKSLYSSSSLDGFTRSRIGISVISITDNFLLIVSPSSYSSSFNASVTYRIMVCTSNSNGVFSIIAYYDFDVTKVSNKKNSYSEIKSRGFSLCKISQNKYIWVIRDAITSSTRNSYYFYLITLSSDYNTISIKYIVNNAYQNNNDVILYLSKNISVNEYCYALVSKNNTQYQEQGFPVFFTIKYNENDDTLLFSTMVLPSIDWTNASIFTWVMSKGVYGLFGQTYNTSFPPSTSIYGHIINNDGTLNFITVIQSTEIKGTNSEILPLIFNTSLNKTLVLQWGSTRAWLCNVFLEPFNVVKRIKESISEIFGLTKTKCKVRKAGKVWVLNKTTEV